MSYLILIKHFGLFHFLHGYNLTSVFESANSDFSKGSSAYNVQWLKVFARNLLPPRLVVFDYSYIFLLSCASLCRMSCFMSSCSPSLRLSFAIFFESMSQANILISNSLTFFSFFLFVLQFLILFLNVRFGALSL